jgi:hypothetical protein
MAKPTAAVFSHMCHKRGMENILMPSTVACIIIKDTPTDSKPSSDCQLHPCSDVFVTTN